MIGQTNVREGFDMTHDNGPVEGERKGAGVSILIVDDHMVVIEGISGALYDNAEFRVAGYATDGARALAMAEELRPDIVIMDISMPGMNGIEATRRLKSLYPAIRIIIFTMYSNREYMVDLFKAGVSAYILKESPLSELISAIRAVREGGTYFSPKAREVFMSYLMELEEGGNEMDDIERLSMREREVFVLLAEGRPVRQISDQLNISPKTVESHKYNIMEKLDARTVVDLTRIAIRKNLIKA